MDNGLQSTRTQSQLVGLPSQLVPKLSRTHGQLVPKYKRNTMSLCFFCHSQDPELAAGATVSLVCSEAIEYTTVSLADRILEDV